MAKKTRTELSTLAINTNLPDNTQELITPTTERSQLTDERESVVNYKDDLGGTTNAGKFLTVAVDGESLTMVDAPTGDVTGTGVAGQVTIWNGTNNITSKAMLVLDDTSKVLKIIIPSENASGGISIDQQGTTGSGSLVFLDDGVYKAQIVYNVSDGNLTLNSNGDIEITADGDTVISGGTPIVENVRISSGGDVGISMTSSFAKLNVKAKGTNPYQGINVGSSALDSIYAYITHNGTKALIGSSGIQNDAAAYTPLSLQTSEQDRLTISTGGDATFNSQTIDVKGVSAGNTSLRLTANGQTAGTDSLDIIVDGSSSYLYNRANTSLVLGTNSTPRLTISSGGQVGIGISQSTFALQVVGTMYSTDVKVNNLGSGSVFSNGAGILTNTDPSDSRLKTNIENIDYGLSEILKLRSVKFNWLDGDKNSKKQFGFIAQEVKEIIPESVSEFDYDDNKRFGLEKNAIYVGLVKAIQEQQTIIEDLKARIEKLEL